MPYSLIRGVNWIGDAVMTLPAIRCIRENLKTEKLDLLVKEWVAPVFEKDPNIDGIIYYSPSFEGPGGKIRGARILRARSYKRAILLQNAFDAAVLAFLARIPERIGYRRDGRGILLTKGVNFTEKTGTLHHILYYLEMLRNAGFHTTSRMPWIYIEREEHFKGIKMLSSLRRPVIILNPGATYGSAKRWPAQHFSRLASMVINTLGGSTVLIGSKKEVPIGKEIGSLMGKEHQSDESFLDLTGNTTLRELISIIAHADMVVTNDSGPMHISYAVGTPLIALFGSTDPDLTGPPEPSLLGSTGMPLEYETDSPARVLRKTLTCSPCFERECPGRETECLSALGPEEVFSELSSLLPRKKAVFFDRDGTLCRDAHYLNRMEDFEPFPGLSELRKLKEAGFLLIGITNQSGIARGIVERSFVGKINRIFVERYGFDDFFYCPHHPDEHCACRKPSTGMLMKARKKYGIDLKESIVVGDKESDMELAERTGAKCIDVRDFTGGDPGKSPSLEAIVRNILYKDDE